MTIAIADRLDEVSEATRSRLGLTNGQWRTLQKEHEMSAEEIEKAYKSWIEWVKKDLDEALRNADYRIANKPHLSAIQLSEVLRIGEFHLCNIRQRGKLRGIPHGRRVAYSRSDVIDLLDRTYEKTRARNPLSKAFVRYVTSTD